ncbi:DNA-directed RNA polymerase sigma-70 factor [Paenibacillus sp. J31TS4]|uniref:sigma-70 family RNA polymerase sigma factor n=1 Tax=Paenibacillus sp. J31TS4 TaxID=2807195 RepID=UPI001B047015|nr:sigma-70 family RNA polymerase sigma factor [Paenibacillus sp. J31TS4]GIP40812.1 DNA-directed RNA polymerase sigma-70 factor [Paenibacillus sp. J31TS4]
MRVQTDYELMELVMSKHRPALEELYDRHVKLVYSFAIKATRNEQLSREIVQLVFLRLWTTTKGYDPDKGLFVNWLLTITRNLTVDHLRKERRQRPAASLEWEQWELLTDAPEKGPEAQVTRKITREEIRKAYKFLSDSQIRLIEYVYWEGHTLSEVADLEQEPLGTIKSRLHQSLKLLRTNMQAHREG